MRELTTSDFIKKSKIIHGNQYDYSMSNYINNTTKVKIICKEHGVFEQTPHHHKRGGGCKSCYTYGAPRLTKDEFVKKAKLVHGDKYDYSKVNYEKNNIKIEIICPIHNIFKQTPGAHLMKQGCPDCNVGNVKISEVLSRIKKSHGNKYTYDFSNYNGISGKIKIKCDIHGVFYQRISDHTKGSGCPGCGGRIKITTKDFITKSNEVHNNKYDYSLVEYKNSKTKVIIICPKHGEFKQTQNCHNKGQGCPSCKSSLGEKIIERFLINNKINFKKQHKFKDCKNKRALPFDFYLPEHNLCIEFNGRQHYEPVNAFGGIENFNKIKLHDKIKKEYCKNNNIDLISIKYTENVNTKINNHINFHL